MLLLSACTTNAPLSPDTSALRQQIATISPLTEGETIQQAIESLPYAAGATFDLNLNGQRFSLISVRNDDTGAAYGLYFIDGRLAYLLPRVENNLFSLCQLVQTPPERHWTQNPIGPMQRWLAARSVLGKGNAANQQDAFLRVDSSERQSNSPLKNTALSIGYFWAYSTVFVAAAPFITFGLLKEDSREKASEQVQLEEQRDRQVKRDRHISGFPTIQLGMIRGDVIKLMGEPDHQQAISPSAEYLWFAPLFGIRLDDGKVTLKEMPYWGRGTVTVNDYSYFIRENKLDLNKECQWD